MNIQFSISDGLMNSIPDACIYIFMAMAVISAMIFVTAVVWTCFVGHKVYKQYRIDDEITKNLFKTPKKRI